MAGPTDAELQKLREDNEKLREKITEADSKRAGYEAEANAQIEYTTLLAEKARLEAQLASAQEAAKAATVRAGASGVMDSLKEELSNAEVVADTVPGPVDTNAHLNNDSNGGN